MATNRDLDQSRCEFKASPSADLYYSYHHLLLVIIYHSTLLPATSPHPLPPLKPRTQTAYKEHRLANTPDKGDANRWRGRVGSACNNYTDVTVDDKHRWSDESSHPPTSTHPHSFPRRWGGWVGGSDAQERHALSLLSTSARFSLPVCGGYFLWARWEEKDSVTHRRGKAETREDEWMECWVGKDVDKSGRKQRLIERRK